ncbi:MAG: class II SORL domain-containing protein [Kiritimatiellae bacterium]|nr:class II SORL domain-containing protein [Kiritimatiellia bacterium]
MEKTLESFVKTADWKNEKHVPVIDAPASVKTGETFDVDVTVGKEIPHPNTVEHHIAWIALHYVPEGAQTSIEIARLDLSAHGVNAFTAASAKFRVALQKGGALYATAYCNLHGLWASSAAIAVE